jgi:hypothetical protein
MLAQHVRVDDDALARRAEDDWMRIVIAAPPKAGNSWVKCLLANMYDLAWLRGDQTPDSPNLAAFKSWAGSGAFPDDSIFHQHYHYSDELARAVEAAPAHLVTIIRDPYDAIVSLYFFVQAQAAEGDERERLQRMRSNPIAGKPLDDPETIAFLDEALGPYLDRAADWLESGRSVVLRYEELHRDPLAALTRAAEQIQPLPPERIAAAITACEADTLRTAQPGLRKRIRTATVGDWRNHLTSAHLERFRASHAERIRAIGYEVQ